MSEGNLEKLIRDMILECKLFYLKDKESITFELDIQPDLNSNAIMDPENANNGLVSYQITHFN
jgi:hypothetical protein